MLKFKFLDYACYFGMLFIFIAWFAQKKTKFEQDQAVFTDMMSKLVEEGEIFKKGVRNINMSNPSEFVKIRQYEFARKERLWELYGKVHDINLKQIATTVKKALLPFEFGIKREDVFRACSLEEIDAVCFFIINGTIMSRPLPNESTKQAAIGIAKLLYQTQEAFNDTFPNMIFPYNTMNTPRIVPGTIPNNTMNATVGSSKFLAMAKQLCPEMVERYKTQGSHMSNPYRTFIIHERTPIFSSSGMYGCGIDIPFPHHSYHKWNRTYPALIKKHDSHEWDTKKDKLFWRGNITGGYIVKNTYAHMPRIRLVTKNNTDYSLEFTHMFDHNGTLHFQNNEIMLYDSYKYKYLFDIDSDGRSEEFAQLLASGSVILKHDPLYYEFFYDWMIPNLHFLPIAGDFSNLDNVIKKLRENPEMAKQIADEAFDFYKKSLKPDAIYAYIYNLLTSYWWLHLFEYVPQHCEKCIVYQK